MIRVSLAPRPVRVGAAGVGVAGAVLLAGCSAGAGAGASAGPYADGTYTADGTYNTPESVEQITVTLTLQDDVVTEVEVAADPQRPESAQYQSQFIGGIADEVVGQSIDDLSVDRVAGSSLTSGGFNAAVEEIKAEAAE